MAKPVTVTLGAMEERARYHMDSGRFASMSELVRAGLRALDREEVALTELLRAKVDEALADDRPDLSPDELVTFLADARRARAA